MHRVPFFTRKLLFMAAGLALLSACMTPAVIFSLGYGVHASALDTKARIKSEQIGQLISTAPKVWMFQEFRLLALLSHGPGQLEAEHALIVALDGTPVASVGTAPDWPAMRREATLFDAGRAVGRLILARSVWPLLMETAQAGAVGVGLGIGFFILLWTIPVRALRRAASDLREEKERLEVTLQSIADAVVTTDPAGRILSLNPAAERLLGWTFQEAVGAPVDLVLVLEDEGTGATLEVMTILGSGDGKSEASLMALSGRRVSVQISVAAIQSETNTPWGHVLILHDIDEISRLSKKLEWQATHDPLTELANRREFERHVAIALEGAKTRGENHALLYMDLDQFKVVNDTCGHAAGDQLLRQITALLHARVRRADCLARLGGDEFALLLTHCPSAKAEAIAAELLRAIAEERFIFQDNVFSVGISIGLVELTPAFNDGAALLMAADSACYTAKVKGKGRVQIYRQDDATLKATTSQMLCAAQITRALDDGRFVLHFQRYRALGERGDGREHGEVLLRLIDEDNRIIPPSAFIPAAERFDLMVRLDHWVIAETFAQYSRLPPSSHQTWSINLSGQSLSHDDLMSHIVSQADIHGVPPSEICFEITETAAINNLTHARALVVALRRKGFRFALDDFGSGLSSFAYLKQLPIDYLKIDGCFVRGLLDDPLDRAILTAAHDIARILGIRTVAEFVESEATLRELRRIGIDYAQGYAIARPVPLIAHVNAQLAALETVPCGES